MCVPIWDLRRVPLQKHRGACHEENHVCWTHWRRKDDADTGFEGTKIEYHKTQFINHDDYIIDTPGEYAENTELSRALIVFSHEADIIGLLINATEPYCLYSPNIVSLSTREVIGIATHIRDSKANLQQVALWFENIGCKKIFYVDSVTGEGIPDLIAYLHDTDDTIPWDENMHCKYSKRSEI